MTAGQPGTPPPIALAGLRLTIGDKNLLDEATAFMPAGGFTGIVGPNGSGKTTLLSAIARWITPHAGEVRLRERPVGDYSRRDFARVVAAVEQHSVAETELTVEQIVDLGTIPHAGGRFGRTDTRAVVTEALATMGIEELRHRSWQSLSGGERQKTQIARALAQQPQVLLLDEPTNHLDVAAALDTMALLASMPVTAVAALHDLSLAGLYCDHLIVLCAGRVVAQGSPAEVLTPELLAQVYGLDAEVMAHPRSGAPMVVLCGTIGSPHRGDAS
ncbi:MAG: ABC transporter ATP-binding protein [Gordonia sp. (in: high G+C Gram-positive bacteria)]|uniref:ABC transporter ATP-binding protein n=1 Tax=Gordonia sp. (in: high G+C Gram-positive bacteria) TaxID=84139 RepID=UPI003BB54955